MVQCFATASQVRCWCPFGWHPRRGAPNLCLCFGFSVRLLHGGRTTFRILHMPAHNHLASSLGHSTLSGCSATTLGAGSSPVLTRLSFSGSITTPRTEISHLSAFSGRGPFPQTLSRSLTLTLTQSSGSLGASSRRATGCLARSGGEESNSSNPSPWGQAKHSKPRSTSSSDAGFGASGKGEAAEGKFVRQTSGPERWPPKSPELRKRRKHCSSQPHPPQSLQPPPPFGLSDPQPWPPGSPEAGSRYWPNDSQDWHPGWADILEPDSPSGSQRRPRRWNPVRADTQDMFYDDVLEIQSLAASSCAASTVADAGDLSTSSMSSLLQAASVSTSCDENSANYGSSSCSTAAPTAMGYKRQASHANASSSSSSTGYTSAGSRRSRSTPRPTRSEQRRSAMGTPSHNANQGRAPNAELDILDRLLEERPLPRQSGGMNIGSSRKSAGISGSLAGGERRRRRNPDTSQSLDFGSAQLLTGLLKEPTHSSQLGSLVVPASRPCFPSVPTRSASAGASAGAGASRVRSPYLQAFSSPRGSRASSSSAPRQLTSGSTSFLQQRHSSAGASSRSSTPRGQSSDRGSGAGGAGYGMDRGCHGPHRTLSSPSGRQASSGRLSPLHGAGRSIFGNVLS